MPIFRIPFFLFSLILLTGASWSLASAQQLVYPEEGTPIAEIRVEGTNRLAPAGITRRMELREGGIFTRSAYRRDLQSISNIGTIDPIDLRILWEENEDGELILTVSVRELSVIRNIKVIGNSEFSREQIVSQLDFEEGDLATVELEAATARNLRSFYRQGGYKAAGINVDVEKVFGEEGLVDVVITIDEGQRIEIDKLIINGNDHFSDFYFKMRISNAPGLLFFSNYFDEALMDDDLAFIRETYRQAGFLDVEVRRQDLIYDEENSEITIVINVDEGPRYRVDEVRTEGITYFTPEEVRRVTDDLTDRYYKGERLGSVLDDLRRLYGNQGYIDTEFGYRLDKEPESRTVDIVLSVKESPVVRVGEVRLMMEDYQYDVEPTGVDQVIDKLAPPTEEETVRREIRLEPGEKYRTSEEVRTVERLRNLGIFREVQVVREPTSDPRVRDAVVVVDEDPAAAFIGATAGVGERSGPAITLRFEQPNFGGRADIVSASATFGTRNVAYRLRYFDRYMGGSDTSMDVRLYHSTDRYRAYWEEVTGGSVEFGRPLTERLRGFVRLRTEYVDYGGHDDETEEDFDDHWTAAVRPLIAYDRRDSVIYPTRGYYISGGFETGAADGFMLKLLHTYEWYKKPFARRDNVYVYGHTVGLMPYDATDIGLSERFFVGGTGSLRGFRPREVGPRDDLDDDLAIGGATRITQRHEFHFPIQEDFLIGRVFTDLAILEEEPFTLGTPRIGSGVGAILDVGPLKAEIDLAVPVLKEDDDEPQFFHLRLGSNF